MMIFTRAGWANYLSRSFDLGFTPVEKKAIFFAILHNAKTIAATTRRMPKRDQVFLAAFLMRHDSATLETTAALLSKRRSGSLRATLRPRYFTRLRKRRVMDEYSIEVLATANLFRAGHRICVEISSLDLPTGVSGSTNVEYIPYHIASSKTTLHKIYHDARHPSHLLLPVIPDAPSLQPATETDGRPSGAAPGERARV